MPKFKISKSIHIKADSEKLFSILTNFNSWKVWSPWLIMDPSTIVNVASDNKSYSWNGKRTGSGDMRILQESPNQRITYDLNFIKPWKSNSKVSFEIKEAGDGCLVTWNMDSSLPFFLFFMKKRMVSFVGNDYERGLNLLKDYVEYGEIHSKLNWLGERKHEGYSFVGVRRTCSIAESSELMPKDIGKIVSFGKKEEIFVQYHKWDFLNQTATYTAGIAVESIPSDLPDGVISGHIPETKIYTLEHVGPYHHLGNAWSTMYTMQRGKEFKIRKDIHPFETYGNDPNSTHPKELITHVNFAIK